jgi:hypothetical protein
VPAYRRLRMSWKRLQVLGLANRSESSPDAADRRSPNGFMEYRRDRHLIPA